MLNRDRSVLAVVHHHRGHGHTTEQLAHIEFLGHPCQQHRLCSIHAVLFESGVEGLHLRVAHPARTEGLCEHSSAELIAMRLDELVTEGPRHPVGIAVALDESSPTVDDEQPLGPLGITNRERHTDRAARVKCRDEHPVDAGVVENCNQIVGLVVDARRWPGGNGSDRPLPR